MTIGADAVGSRTGAGVRTVRPVESVPAIGRGPLQRFAHIPLGTALCAEVKGKLRNGAYLVDVAGAEVRMALPGNPREGDRLRLCLVARSPQVTFLLTAPRPAEVSCLSATGQALARILGLARGGELLASLPGAEPILPNVTTDPVDISRCLQNRFVTSGLFYEAHVAEWVNGARALEDLAREPQQRLGAESPPNSNCNEYSENVALDLARLVNLQLEALEQGRIIWRGELWPGLPLQWEVSKQTVNSDCGGNRQADVPPQLTWKTVLDLELPALGSVTAHLQLTGDRLQIRIATAESESASKLADGSPELLCSLSACGLAAPSIEVSHHAES